MENEKKIVQNKNIENCENLKSIKNKQQKQDFVSLNSQDSDKKNYKKQGKLDAKTKFILSIIILSSAFLLLFVYSTYITFEVYEKYHNSTMGDYLVFDITSQGNYIKTITYPSSLLTGLKYNQQIDIKSQNIDKDLKIRAKITFTDYKNNTKNIEIDSKEKWYQGDDGYFYYDGIISSNETVTFVKNIQINDQNTKQINSVLAVIIECLPSDFDTSEIWQTPDNLSI